MFENYFNEADEEVSRGDYAEAARKLLESQKLKWPMLAGGYNSLESIQSKRIQMEGYTFKVQFNPGRIVSSSAKVDPKSIKERKCFLCPANLPAEQQGIKYKDYLILCNPFPIFQEHFTIPKMEHVPQQIKGNFADLLSLSRDMSRHYTVFYNGPKCGASAPDHMHFQAGNKYFMTIDNDFHQLKNQYGTTLYEKDEAVVSAIDDGLRRIIALEGNDAGQLESWFGKFYEIYAGMRNGDEEPMMNISAFYEDEFGWRVLIFLRDKHRSSHYFAEGEANILLSPAGVDFGGVCITPLEKDFQKVGAAELTEIFKEVSINKDDFETVKQRLSGSI